MHCYKITKPKTKSVPILLSVPHCGTEFPRDLQSEYKKEQITNLDDTDWFVDKLYSFATDLGITIISATYSRWLIDLNRDPQNKNLYTDNRLITGLCPTTNFLGENIYNDNRTSISSDEIKRRLELYYTPYHQQIESLLKEIKDQFGRVLLWDCHSIRSFVPTIYAKNFPDLILSDAHGSSAEPWLSDSVFDILSASEFSVSRNHPFKGGYITRYFGKPAQKQFALQLEMSKALYMKNSEREYDESKAAKIQALLKKNFEELLCIFTN